jgi:phi13 family phage major tail protein
MSKNKDNKVKYNIKNAHYAVQKEDEEGTISFETPVPIKGAVSVSFDANGDITPFYADGIQYYVSAANNGYEGDAEFALIPDQFREDILKEQRDEKGVLHEVSDSGDTQKFAFLFEFDGDQKATRRVLYNCTATRPSIESETKEENVEPGTETITISNSPLANGRVKAQTTVDTDKTVYDGWYKTVYYPETITAATQASGKKVTVGKQR